jgi:hypothetical protein
LTSIGAVALAESKVQARRFWESVDDDRPDPRAGRSLDDGITKLLAGCGISHLHSLSFREYLGGSPRTVLRRMISSRTACADGPSLEDLAGGLLVEVHGVAKRGTASAPLSS